MMFRKETEFQETEIGKIPKDWKIEKLSNLATIIMGQSPSSSTYNREGKGLPFIQGKMEFGRMYPSPTMYTSRPLKIAEEGDILMSVRAPVGDVNIAPYKLCIGRGLVAIRFNSKMANNLFYFYYFQSIKSRLENLGKGSTFKAITKKDLEELRIVYPPLNEQKGIADILLMVDRGIEIVDKTVAKLERIKRALLNELLTGRIRVREENGKLTFYKETEFQDTEIGKIPKEWEIKRLGELLVFGHGKRPSELLPKGIVPVFGAGGLYGYTNTYMIDKPYVLILARVGVGSVGKVYLARGRVWVTDNAIYAYSRQTESVTAYVYYWLQFNRKLIEKHVKRSAGGYAILTLASLKNITIALPPQNEQKNIVETLNAVNNIIEIYEKEKERLLRVKKGLMDLLLTGKIRVIDRQEL
jgi:type I restriction enzyme S subunit